MSRVNKYEVYNKDPEYVCFVPQVGGYKMLWVQSTSERGRMACSDSAAEEMVEKLVEALNKQPASLYPGRYVVTGENTIDDTEETVGGKKHEDNYGKPVRYTFQPQCGDHPIYRDLYRLAGMLNRIEADKWVDVMTPNQETVKDGTAR